MPSYPRLHGTLTLECGRRAQEYVVPGCVDVGLGLLGIFIIFVFDIPA